MRTMLAALAPWGAILTSAVVMAAEGNVDVKVSVQEAMRQGLVDVKVSSLGGTTGDTVKVSVKSRVQHGVQVAVDAGTVFLSGRAGVQNMTGGVIKGEFTHELRYRPGSTIVLVDTQWHHYLVQGYCLDYHKKAPKRGVAMRMAMHDHRAARILTPPPGVNASPWAFQLAIWMDRAGVAPSQVRRQFKQVTDVDVQVAQSLLHNAEHTGLRHVPQDMPADVRSEVVKLYASSPTVRQSAVQVLVNMGDRGRVAMPYVAVNVVGENPGQWALGTLPPVPATPADAVKLLEGLRVGYAQPWVDHLNSVIASGGGWAPAIPPIPAIPGIPGIPAIPYVVPSPGTVVVPGVPTIPGPFAPATVADAYILGLSNLSPLVRQSSAQALGRVKTARSVEALIGALGDADANVKAAAAKSLSQLTGQDFGQDAAKWQQWWAKNQATFGQTQ